MKALLDTNIIIHREAVRVANQDIGMLFKWLDKGRYEKCIHPITIEEIKKNSNQDTVKTFLTKMESYTQLTQVAPLSQEVEELSSREDANDNDKNDTILLNEVARERVDILISEDKKIHRKAARLGLQDRVFTINRFLEKVFAENPDLVNYKILNVRTKKFGELDLTDPFFDTLKEDYPGFETWFNRKAEELAYVTHNTEKNRLLSFLYLKTEDANEPYPDITPAFSPKRRLKVGTLKVAANGLRLGERFMKIIFDNARVRKVEEIYVTIFDKREEQLRLITLLEDYGFIKWGEKGQEELVYVRDFKPRFDAKHPKQTYPYVSSNAGIFMVPIYPEYHTDLLTDSILNNERPADFQDDQPHRNAIAKVYVSRAIECSVQQGDILIFYRTGGLYRSVVTTIAIAEDVIRNIGTEEEFIRRCRNRSVFSNIELSEHWNYKPQSRPFIVNFLQIYSFPTRINMEKLIDLGILAGVDDAPRGFKPLSKEQFRLILNETNSDESFVIY